MVQTNPYESPETPAHERSTDSTRDASSTNKFVTRFVEYIIVLLLLIAVLGMFAAFLTGGDLKPPR
jgi:hypothetical protein